MKDYSKQISAPMVMLATDYNPLLVEYPCIIQPKLDGVRGLISPSGKVYYGRSGQEIPELCGRYGAYGMWIDGEIYKAGVPLATIGGALRKYSELTESLEFHAFDLMTCETQNTRLRKLYSIQSPKFHLVPSCPMLNASEAYSQYLDMPPEVEGIIYRNISAPYIEGRTNTMLKRKRMASAEYKCIDIQEGLGKFYGTLGAFICTLPNGAAFNVSAAELTDEERAKMWADPPINKMLTIRYPSLSKYGIPLQAQFVAVRDPNDT